MLRKILSVIITAAAVSVMVITLEGCSRDRGKRVIVKGSTTVLPITQKAAEAFKKAEGISVFVEGSGSGNGIKALLDGSCDIANSSREMKPEELDAAKEKGITAKEIAVAYDMIVPIVHPSNPVKNLTLDQLKAIYDGSISNWQELGGKDEKIVVVSRDTSSGTYEIWEKKVMKKSDIRNDALLQASNGAVLSTVTENPKAIGYIGFGYINNSIKVLSVNGIVGTIQNGKAGVFPISRKLYMYVNEKNPNEESKKFINFLLGTRGRKLVEAAGFIPL